MRLVVAFLVGCTLCLMPSQASAEQAAGQINSSPRNLIGVSGHQEIRTGPATVNGIGYIHPTQADIGVDGGGFVGIGTAKGVGIDQCADNYDALWTVYTDGFIGGNYFCHDENPDAYTIGDNPSFKIVYANCPSSQTNAWLMYFGGTLWRCLYSDQHVAQSVGVGLETTGGSNVDRNIDVKYSELEHRSQGSGFVGWGTASTFAAPSYTVTQPVNAKINAFLAPLD
jgi:hypothetical protein